MVCVSYTYKTRNAYVILDIETTIIYSPTLLSFTYFIKLLPVTNKLSRVENGTYLP
jgi:hypothetical protein